MTTFQQAIDYVNSYMPVLFPGSAYRYTTSNLNSTDKLLMMGVNQWLEAGHTVDAIPPTGSEPDDIYAEAKRTIETFAASIGQTRQFSRGTFNTPVGRVYMAMLDNPPANAPKPSEGYTQADVDAAVNKALDAVSKAVEGARR